MKPIYLFFAIVFTLLVAGCIEDGYDTSPSSQPRFSVEQLDMGVQFTGNPSPTASFTVYNPNGKIISLNDVRMRNGEYFRLNVDGRSGKRFDNVEIRPGDSIYVFVECTLPPTPTADAVEMADAVCMTVNGVASALEVRALAQNVHRLNRYTVEADETWTADMPYLLTDTLRVDPGATLTLGEGCALLFHDKATLVVEGSIRSEGTATAPVIMRGDRTGNVVADISYDVMSNQWNGVRFARGSTGNHLSHTEIANTCQGVVLDSLTQLTMVNCRVSNSGTTLLTALGGSEVLGLGCELSNAASALLRVEGGKYELHRCTLANWYLFKWPDAPIVDILDAANTQASFVNTVIYGRGDALGKYADDVTAVDVWFKRVAFSEAGSDDARFINCLWECDPMLEYSIVKEYSFTYAPLADSPLLNAADPQLDHGLLPEADRRGNRRGRTLGAYAPMPESQQE